jgi:hypothetical protein
VGDRSYFILCGHESSLRRCDSLSKIKVHDKKQPVWEELAAGHSKKKEIQVELLRETMRKLGIIE